MSSRPAPEPSFVVLFDPHLACRRAIAAMLQPATKEFPIIGEAQSLEELAPVLDAVKPAVVVVGLADGPLDPDVVAGVRRLSRDLRILVLARDRSGDAVARAFQAGANGFVHESNAAETMVEALRAIVSGRAFADPSLAIEGLVWATRGKRAASSTELTPREREVMELLSQGLSPRMMSERLHVSRRTIEFHLAGAYRKLGVHGRIDAIRVFARKQGAPASEHTPGA